MAEIVSYKQMLAREKWGGREGVMEPFLYNEPLITPWHDLREMV